MFFWCINCLGCFLGSLCLTYSNGRFQWSNLESLHDLKCRTNFFSSLMNLKHLQHWVPVFFFLWQGLLRLIRSFLLSCPCLLYSRSWCLLKLYLLIIWLHYRHLTFSYFQPYYFLTLFISDHWVSKLNLWFFSSNI